MAFYEPAKNFVPFSVLLASIVTEYVNEMLSVVAVLCVACEIFLFYFILLFGGLKCLNTRAFMHSNALKLRSDLTWSVVMRSI